MFSLEKTWLFDSGSEDQSNLLDEANGLMFAIHLHQISMEHRTGKCSPSQLFKKFVLRWNLEAAVPLLNLQKMRCCVGGEGGFRQNLTKTKLHVQRISPLSRTGRS